MCKTCGKDEVMTVDAKCSDLCFITYKGFEKDGYVPKDLGIGGGDYVRFSLCIACGQVQDIFPKVFPTESEEF
jgi:hypothetical protein